MALYQSNTQWSHASLVLPLSGGTSWISLLTMSEPDMVLAASLDSMSLTESPPVFPSGHRPPFFTLVDLGEHKPTMDESHTASHERERTVVTVPTMPRMKVILEEKIVVDKWMAKVQHQSPPDHIPWGGSEAASLLKDCPKKRSNLFSSSLVDSRRELDARRIPQISSNPSTKFSRRNLLVLNREIPTCGSVDRTTSATNPVRPHSTSSPKIRRKGYQTAAQQTLVRDRIEPKASYRFSFYPIATKKHSNLAVRRGHKTFPRLKLQQVARSRRADITSFDSIPTAFRGSPIPSSFIFNQVQSPAPQNLSLAEMLDSLREKCVSFSRASLPADWFYRPRPYSKGIRKLSDTASESHFDEDEWAFAEPLMDMINSFSAKVKDSDAHSAFLENDTDIPILSCGPCDNSNFSSPALLVVDNHTEDPHSSPGPLAPPAPPRPSLVCPSSHRKACSKVKKTVRFADSVVLSECPIIHVSEEPKEIVPANQPRPQKRQSITLSALIPPSPPLSVVRSLQPATQARNSWTNTLRDYTLGSPPSLPLRPLSHRFPTSPKLPLSMDRNLIPRSLNISPLRKSYTQQAAPEIVVNSPPANSASAPTPTFGKPLFLKGKKARVTREGLKISGPLPIGSVVLRPKQNGKDEVNNVTTPLRSIFTKFK